MGPWIRFLGVFFGSLNDRINPSFTAVHILINFGVNFSAKQVCCNIVGGATPTNRQAKTQ
jgi:hypothetical protein